ncbi:MAG: mandelate racemase/muconate lactonizing enzyme family protein [Planctomycetes bacterium]|nr:mandelate racemase/muconate lactonizing enzyme family protein [Planctomycetota bacterium]
MNRREFLAHGAAAVGGLSLAPLLRASDLPRDVKITRVVGFTLTSKRSKVAGKNARLDVHGDTARDRMLRIYTSAGVEGLGNCRAPETDAAKLLGRDPFEFYRRDAVRMTGPLGAGTMPLWDLAGKFLKKPVYELLGGAGSEKVPVYDGSIYFADLLPQYESRWRDRFREELDMGLKLGHRAFKIKIGRGHKWMERAAGDQRDVDVVRLCREHAGKDVLLGVDANNGYDLAGAKRFFERAGDAEIAFAEEMFPETVEDCLEFKAFLRTQGFKTLVADGETQSELAAYKPFIEARAVEVFQGDMNRFGFEGILTEAAWAKEQGLQIAPHNWGSLVGYYMQLHVGRAIENFYRAEHDPLSNDVLIAEGYAIRDGHATVPDTPGCGLALNEDNFATQAQVHFDLKL